MKSLYQICCCLLIALWIYAGVSKLLDYQHTRTEMAQQIFDASFAGTLSWLVPLTELVMALLIAIPLFSRLGLYVSAALLSVFSIYILGGVLHWYESVPCSCGGVLGHLAWIWHLLFNLGFLVVNMTALLYGPNRKEAPGIKPF